MIDINTIINNAIQQEVSKIVTDFIDPYIANMKREYQQQIAAMREEVEQLKQQRAVSPATGEGLAKDVVQDLLENNPTIKQAVYEIAYEAGQAVLNEHADAYDHDEYDNTVTIVEDFPDLADLVTKEDLLDARVSFSI